MYKRQIMRLAKFSAEEKSKLVQCDKFDKHKVCTQNLTITLYCYYNTLMKSEFSRRDFLKLALAGAGAVAFSGLISACSEEQEPRCDSKHTATLINKGDYVLWEGYRIELFGFQSTKDKDGGNKAVLGIIKGERGEKGYSFEGERIMRVGQLEYFDLIYLDEVDSYGNKKAEFSRAIYRCDQYNFAFWKLSDLPELIPTLTSTPIIPTPTRTPAAVFP